MPDFTWLVQALGLGARIWFGLTLACTLLLFGHQIGLTFLKDVSETWLSIAKVGLVLFGSLSFVTVSAGVWAGVQWCFAGGYSWLKARADRRAVEEAAKERKATVNKVIDDFTEREREILAYLVTRGERHFVTNMNGGRAASLVGRRVIDMAVVGGQSVSALATPFSVDPEIWEALLARKDEFVHPNPKGRPPYSDSPF